jgi:hypothetical protein
LHWQGSLLPPATPLLWLVSPVAKSASDFVYLFLLLTGRPP